MTNVKTAKEALKLAEECRQTDSGKSLKLAQLGLKLAKENVEKDQEMVALHLVGSNYFLKGEYRRAMSYYTSSLEIAQLLRDPDQLTINNISIGLCYKIFKDYQIALEFQFKALEYDNPEFKSRIYNNIATLYQELGDNEKAFEYLTKAQEDAEKRNEYNVLIATLINLGINLDHRKNYNEALRYLKQALRSCRTHDYPFGEVYALINIGNTYLHFEKYNHSLKFYKQASESAKKYGFAYEQRITQVRLGQVFQQQELYEKALKFYLPSLKESEERKFANLRLDCLEAIPECYKGLGNFEMAFEFMKKLVEFQNEQIEQLKIDRFKDYHTEKD